MRKQVIGCFLGWGNLEVKLKKKYQVFISSTYIDLIEERQAAVQAVLTQGHIPAGMELFAASNQSQWEVIKKWIEDSDAYMLILGARYGSIEPNSGKSYTQLEYEYALKLKKPAFSVVIRQEQIENLPAKYIETENPNKLDDFRKLIMDNNLVELYNDSKDIANAVFKSLRNIEITYEEKLVGWVRADQIKEKSFARISQREPWLALKVNDGQPIDIKIENPTNIDLVGYEPILEIPSHLETFLTQEEVTEYNEKIGKVDYSEYRNLKVLTHNYKVNALPMAIEMSNNGTLCASKAHATIEFPSFVVVKENEKINSLVADWENELASISEIQNPIELAQKRYEYSLKPHSGSALEMALLHPDLQVSIDKIFASQRLIGNGSGYNFKNLLVPNRLHHLQDNNIIVKLNELMHEDVVTINDYSLIPLNKGKGVIKITLHCQEYLHSESYELGIKVG